MLRFVSVLSVHTVWSRPADLVLLVLLNESNALQHVSDVIDSSLLHCQLAYCVVQVNALVRGFPQELNKFLSQLYQTVLLPRSFAKDVK